MLKMSKFPKKKHKLFNSAISLMSKTPQNP